MSLKSILQNRKRNKTFRQIRRGTVEINTLPPYERGLYYEEFVCRWLKKRGYRILDRNYYGRRRREIDIIAKDKDTLVFIEVKARRRNSVYTALKAIDRKKRLSLMLVSRDYIRQLERSGIDVEDLKIRYDVVALAFDREGVPDCIDHYISYLEPKHELI